MRFESIEFRFLPFDTGVLQACRSLFEKQLMGSDPTTSAASGVIVDRKRFMLLRFEYVFDMRLCWEWYHLLHTIEYKLRLCGDHRCWATIRDVLSTHQRLTVEYSAKEKGRLRRNHLRLCSTAEPEHRQIYQYLNLKETPLPRKIMRS